MTNISITWAEVLSEIIESRDSLRKWYNSTWKNCQHSYTTAIGHTILYWLPLERSICRRSFALTPILTSALNILSETNLVSFPVSRGKICPLFNAGVICQRRKQIPVVAYCTIYRLLGGKGRGEESATIIRGSFFKVGHLNERDTKKPPWGDGGERVASKAIYVPSRTQKFLINLWALGL